MFLWKSIEKYHRIKLFLFRPLVIVTEQLVKCSLDRPLFSFLYMNVYSNYGSD